MNKTLFAVMVIFLFACRKHPNGYNTEQSTSKDDYSENTDSISKGEFVPEEKTDYIFVTTNATVGGDTIYKSEN